MKQNDKIEELDGHVKILQNAVNLLKRGQEENEQYGRRLCLRIEGIKPEKDKNADSCLNKVKNVLDSLGIDIPENVIDRAHRVGKAYKNQNNVFCHRMIVHFTTWRHRTMVYRARDKSINAKYKFRLDLTKSRYDILKVARSMLITKDGKVTQLGDESPIKYVFVDINCRIVALSNIYFDSLAKFNEIVGIN